MFEIIFAIFISIGLPLFAFIYAYTNKRSIPFLLGVLSFICSQVLIRIPVLQYLQVNTTTYTMISVINPVLFALIMGLSAGVFEEFARYIMMKFFMKHHDWRSGFFLGAGHGGIESILFVGISALTMMFSSPVNTHDIDLFVGGIERFFAMLLHIGLSIILLQGVIQKKFIYVMLAVVIHGFVNALISIFPLFIPPNFELISIEVSLAIISLVIFGYSLLIKRRGVLK